MIYIYIYIYIYTHTHNTQPINNNHTMYRSTTHQTLTHTRTNHQIA